MRPFAGMAGARGETTMGKALRTRAKIGMVTVAVASMLGTVAVPGVAYAKTEEEARSEIQLAEEAVEAADGDARRLRDEIEAAGDRMEQLEDGLPGKREDAASTMRSLYKMYSDLPAEVSIILGTDSADVMLSELFLYESVSTTNIKGAIGMSQELAGIREEIAEKGDELKAAETRLRESEERRDEATAVLKRILNAPPAIEGCEPIDWSLSDDEIVAEWAPRIDAYLEGYPLEGHGEDFVRAGIKYGVDPRISVTISNTESTRGKAMLVGKNNPFGWLQHSFDSLEDAIYAHAEYMTCSYYNGRLDAKTAQTYCPPVWQSWLEDTLSAAQSI